LSRRWLAAAALLGLAGCGEFTNPGESTVTLTIVPVFNAADPYAAAAASADSLRIIVLRDSSGVFLDTVATATAAIDSLGEVNTTINVLLVESPSTFRIVLQARRSTDGLIVFSGEDTVVVTSEASGGEGQQVEIPVAYVGPRAARIVLTPADTALPTVGSFAYTVAAYDSLDALIPGGVEVRFFLVTPADSAKLTVNRLTGLATSIAGQTGQVLVYGRTIDGLAADTGRVFVGAVPAGVKFTPGHANLGVGDTLTITGQVADPLGNPIAGSTVSWVSRSPSVATINATTGKVTAVSTGTAVMVASASVGSDSILVTVVPATNAVMEATSADRVFRVAHVGDTVVVDVTSDMRFTPAERLGSYLATLKWNGATLQFIDVQSADFGSPVINAFADSLNFSAASASPNPASLPAVVKVAKIRFRALASGSTAATLVVKEISSAMPPLYTNLLQANRVTVTSGSVTVRP
jgi:hypothetical protein